MNSFSRNKHFTIMLLCLGAALIVAFMMQSKFGSAFSVDAPDVIDSPGISEASRPLKVPSQNQAQQQTVVTQQATRIVTSSADVYGKYSGTKSQRQEVNKWLFEHGYTPPNATDEENVYNSYNHEALQIMAKNGDISALHVLADRYLDSDYIHSHGIDILNVFEIRSGFLKEAAIRGSTRALVELGLADKVKNRYAANSIDESKAAEIGALVFFKAAELRGDPQPFVRGIQTAQVVGGISITERDMQQIDERAHEIYTDLQAKRTQLGLGDFDNSMSETVMNYFVPATDYPDVKK